MAIYTPRGLKIRFTVDYAFALMARLYPRAKAFSILKTVEGLEYIPAVFATVVGVVCFVLRLEPIAIGVSVFLATILGNLMNLFGLYVVPGLVVFGTAYSYVGGFGLVLVVLAGVGYYFTGWEGVFAFFAGRVTAGIVNHVLDLMQTKHLHSATGMALTAGERNFLNAYRLHASRLGVTTDLEVSDDERAEDNWKKCFENLAVEYPAVVARFTVG